MNYLETVSRRCVALLTLAAAVLGVCACSESSSPANDASTGGSSAANTSSGGSSNTSIGGASATTGGVTSDTSNSKATGGTSSSGTTVPSSGGSTSSSSGGSDGGATADTIGRFTVTLNEANEELSTKASTTVSGRVYDGVNPSQFITEAIAEDANCTVYKITVPYCEGGCTDGVCVAENTCKPYPAGKNVGEVAISGITTTEGQTSFALTLNNNNYRTGGGLSMQYPGFKEGDPIKLTAAGGDYTPFEITTKGIAPLVVSSESYTLSKTKAIDLTWTAADASVGSHILVNINLSHHGKSTGFIECNVADNGALTIPAEFVSKLIELGVAGYPTLSITRDSDAYAQLATGRVALVVTSPFLRTIAVEGFRSCQEDTDCADQTCDKDLKLCK